VSYVRGAHPFATLHKTIYCIGPGLCGTSENSSYTRLGEYAGPWRVVEELDVSFPAPSLR
jgi:hypothetical protein